MDKKNLVKKSNNQKGQIEQKRNKKNKEIKKEMKFMNNLWVATSKIKNLFLIYFLIFNSVFFK